MSSIEEAGTHSGLHVLPVVSLSSSLIPAFMPCCLTVCYAWWWWCRGGNGAAWMGHAQLQCAPIGKLCKNCRLCPPPNSLISWARCWCCCLSVQLAATAVISAYLNGELITSSQFSLSSVHHCLNPHEDQSILGTARVQSDDSQSVFCIVSHHLQVYIFIHPTYYRTGGGQSNKYFSRHHNSIQHYKCGMSVRQWFSGLFVPLLPWQLTERCWWIY